MGQAPSAQDFLKMYRSWAASGNIQQATETKEVIIYTPHTCQRAIAEDPHRFKVACVGRQFGKTEMALSELIMNAIEKPGSNWWYIAPYFAQAKDIAWSRLLEKLTLLPDHMYKTNGSDLSVTFYNNAFIKLMGAEDPDRLRGNVLDGIVADEYAFWKNGSTFIKAIRAALEIKKGGCTFISTPNGYNFFYDLFCNENLDDEWKSFHYTSYDNPYLTKDGLDRIKLTTPALTFAQEYMAEFNKPEGAIWGEFSRDLHVIPKYRANNESPIYASLDFGFAIGHPTAFMLHEMSPDGTIRTFDGFLQTGKDPNQIVGMIDAYTKGLTISRIYCDSARPDLIEMLKKASFPATAADKDVELGIAKVAEYLRIDPISNKPRWQICGHLKDMIAQIESYRWQEVRADDGKFKNRPLKEDDDAADALRYFLYTFSKPNQNYNQEVRQLMHQKMNEDFY